MKNDLLLSVKELHAEPEDHQKIILRFLRRSQTLRVVNICKNRKSILGGQKNADGIYLDPTTLEKNGYFAQQMAFLTNSDASLTERLKLPRLSKKL